jgi:uncharacterized protein DUF2849
MPRLHQEPKPQWVVSGQDLLSGEVVYFTPSNWVAALSSAHILEDESQAVSAIDTIQQHDRTVLFPYRLRVVRDAHGRLAAVHFREGVRATGPSNRFHGKQADLGEVHHV